MSVIGNVLISQRVDSALGDDSEVESVAPTEADQDQVLPVQSEPTETSLDTAVTGDSSDMDNINSDSNLENNNQNESLATSSKDQQAVSSYTPLSTPAVCTPGHFVCEAPGLRAGYFACDSGGFALPAVCGAKEVCYQIEKSILCDAPKV
ncbi:hypothetical protein GGI05_007437 [Coemansia sp. RSA 2603]|nr:hypothetical protein GGI05_007437 [Coemansia sp. RSA 2603]